MTTRSYICASPELLREHNGPPEHPAQLRSFPCLDSNPHDLGTEWRLASPDGELAIKIEARVHCNHLKALLLACQQGLGLALLPDYIVQEHLQQGSLVSVLPDWTRAETPVWLVYPHADLSAKARLFIDFLVQHLR
jgi:DNA-binding transcriptional LysR family regulator